MIHHERTVIHARITSAQSATQLLTNGPNKSLFGGATVCSCNIPKIVEESRSLFAQPAKRLHSQQGSYEALIAAVVLVFMLNSLMTTTAI